MATDRCYLFITVRSRVVCMENEGTTSYLLSTEFVSPTHYFISLQPELHKSSPFINGTVEIDLDVKKQTNCITLHSFELRIEHASLKKNVRSSF